LEADSGQHFDRRRRDNFHAVFVRREPDVESVPSRAWIESESPFLEQPLREQIDKIHLLKSSQLSYEFVS